jgi:hypothetical protein
MPNNWAVLIGVVVLVKEYDPARALRERSSYRAGRSIDIECHSSIIIISK